MGFILHQGATVTCAHAGQASVTVPDPRVSVSGQRVAVQPVPWTVTGCTLPPPPAGNGPCVTATWVTGALRVKASGQPVVLSTSQAICAPTGTPLIVVAQQTRVRAQ